MVFCVNVKRAIGKKCERTITYKLINFNIGQSTRYYLNVYQVFQSLSDWTPKEFSNFHIGEIKLMYKVEEFTQVYVLFRFCKIDKRDVCLSCTTNLFDLNFSSSYFTQVVLCIH